MNDAEPAQAIHHNPAMQQQASNPATAGVWAPRLAALAIAALAAGSAAYWWLKFPSAPALNMPAAIAGASSQPNNPPDASTLARALGANAASAAQAAGPANEPARVNVLSRLALQGVIASGSRAGTALIAVDGKPARAFRVGHRVEGDLLLQAVTTKQVVLATQLTGPAVATLDMATNKR